MLGIKEKLKSLRSQSRNYRGRRNHVSMELKIQAVDEYLQGKATITDLSKKYQVSRTTIYKWISIFASGKLISDYAIETTDVKPTANPMPRKKENPAETPEEELARLREENKKLQEALKMAEWSNHAKDVMIDLAEKTFNIPIRKKSGAKQ